ncbi:MAG: DOMON-like domain-containing protein [Lysobacterales bacterium]|nr:MAG: DOMON-like domain-containing protein [Xanthomonadales bacterium]
MTERSLVPHGSSAEQPALAIVARAELEERSSTVRFSYRLTGDLSQVAIPHRQRSQRAERLWEHTCFEAFIAPGPGPRYFELNFSPSTLWAAYVLDDYRKGMRPLTLAAAPAIAVARTPNELHVTAAIEVGAFAQAPWPWRIGLTAVVEDRAGGRAYFALVHPRENPDFHDAAGFAVLLDGSAR